MEVLRAGRRKVISIFYVEGTSHNLKELLDLAARKGVALKTAGRRQLDERSRSENHQGVIAVVELPQLRDFQSFVANVMSKNKKPVVVVLDSITDPRNFGAILRSAEAFGVCGAVFAKNRSCEINSTVIKASAGATEYMEFCRVTNISRTLEKLHGEGFHIIAAETNGKVPLDKFKPSFPLAVVLGSEGKGIRPLVKKNCDETIRIAHSGNVGSLNVSAAAAVIFYRIYYHEL